MNEGGLMYKEIAPELEGMHPLTPEDFAEGTERAVAECDPSNYEIKIPGGMSPEEIASEIKKRQMYPFQSGFIDWRKNEDGKFTIWIGMDHMSILHDAGLPFSRATNDYFAGIKGNFNHWTGDMIIPRDMIGKSCCRPDEHFAKAIDAAETALQAWAREAVSL